MIYSFSNPFKPLSGIVVLRGNLAPQGAVIKPSAATPELLDHRGRAVVFENIEQLHETIDDENLEIDETCVMVLKGAGPKGYPGFAEVGNMPLPPKLLRKGITDIVRVSDGRMSGTAFGTVVLHVAPESAAGGPLALVRTGDIIELNVPERRLHLEVSDEELARRKAEWIPPEPPPADGTDCFSIMSCKRTRELISTFWSVKAARKFRGIPIDRKPSRRVRYVGISWAEKLLRRSKARRLTSGGQPSRHAPEPSF